MKIYCPKLSIPLLFVLAVILTGCKTTTSADFIARIPEQGEFINGRDSVQSNNFAVLFGQYGGLKVTEFDRKPFFVEYPSALVGKKGKWLKEASPISVVLYNPSGANVVRMLAINPGLHSLRFSFVAPMEYGIFGNYQPYSAGEITVEFTAENQHVYRIDPNLAGDKKSWHPTITDIDSVVKPQGQK